MNFCFTSLNWDTIQLKQLKTYVVQTKEVQSARSVAKIRARHILAEQRPWTQKTYSKQRRLTSSFFLTVTWNVTIQYLSPPSGNSGRTTEATESSSKNWDLYRLRDDCSCVINMTLPMIVSWTYRGVMKSGSLTATRTLTDTEHSPKTWTMRAQGDIVSRGIVMVSEPGVCSTRQGRWATTDLYEVELGAPENE